MSDGCALLQRTVGGEECEMGRASAFGQARGGLRRGCDARMRTARGQREQESGDEWRTRGVVFLKRSATAVLKVF